MHIPVLQKEVLEYLDPKPNKNFIDCTIGEAGHSLAILEKIAPNGKVLGIDWSSDVIKKLKFKLSNFKFRENLILVCGNFVNLKKIILKYDFESVSGILFDLGMSSWHLEESGRGFSFLRNEPLDMRYGKNSKLTAADILNEYSEEDIEKILREYGEERFSRQIARKIVEIRQIQPIKTTFQLVEIIRKSVPTFYQHRKIHFATKTFQALRIAVNRELDNLEGALSQAVDILNPGGRLVVISFHSLEDRIVKNFFKGEKSIKILTKKVVKPREGEIKTNPRSRSAKLRAVIKINL